MAPLKSKENMPGLKNDFHKNVLKDYGNLMKGKVKLTCIALNINEINICRPPQTVFIIGSINISLKDLCQDTNN